jgi:murein DD-endopeptidase MepM/ murein hydrolase activator NlpD
MDGRAWILAAVIAAAAGGLVGDPAVPQPGAGPFGAARAPPALGPAGTTEDGGASLAAVGPRFGTYAWPVRGPVIRGFEPPESPYGSGHRGIDIATPVGTPVRAAEGGIVAFAGRVAGSLFVSIDHPDGVRTTYSWVSEIRVRRGDAVERGSIVAASGPGHAGVTPPHLHFGARYAGEYIDPMLLLERGSLVGLVHLAPIDAG